MQLYVFPESCQRRKKRLGIPLKKVFGLFPVCDRRFEKTIQRTCFQNMQKRAPFEICFEQTRLPHLKRQTIGSSAYLYDRTADPASRKASYSFANPYVSIIFPIASSSLVKGKDCALSLSASSAFLTAKPSPAAWSMGRSLRLSPAAIVLSIGTP